MKKPAARNGLHKLEAGRKLADWLVRGFNMRLLGQVTITQEIKDAMIANNGTLTVPLAIANNEDNNNEDNHLDTILTDDHKDACKQRRGLDCFFLNPIEKEKKTKLFGIAVAGAAPDAPLIYSLRANWGSFFTKCNLEPLAVISLYCRVLDGGKPYFVIRFDGYVHAGNANQPPPTNMAADAVVEEPVPTRGKLAACVPKLLQCAPSLLGLCA